MSRGPEVAGRAHYQWGAHGLVTLAAFIAFGAMAGCRAEPTGPECSPACGERAYCDSVIERCFCEAGSSGDAEAGCVEHENLCS